MIVELWVMMGKVVTLGLLSTKALSIDEAIAEAVYVKNLPVSVIGSVMITQVQTVCFTGSKNDVQALYSKSLLDRGWWRIDVAAFEVMLKRR